MLYLVSILTAPSIFGDRLASAAASENQGTDAFYPRKYSNTAFKMGINAVIYSLTH